jgi:hypothetical protein
MATCWLAEQYPLYETLVCLQQKWQACCHESNCCLHYRRRWLRSPYLGNENEKLYWSAVFLHPPKSESVGFVPRLSELQLRSSHVDLSSIKLHWRWFPTSISLFLANCHSADCSTPASSPIIRRYLVSLRAVSLNKQPICVYIHQWWTGEWTIKGKVCGRKPCWRGLRYSSFNWPRKAKMAMRQ